MKSTCPISSRRLLSDSDAIFPPESDAACDFCGKRQHLFRLIARLCNLVAGYFRSRSRAFLLATIGTARGTGVRHGSGRHSDDIDKQRTSSPLGRRSPFQNSRVISEIISGELRVTKFHHEVRDIVAAKDRERGIWLVLKEAILSLTPERNELAGLHMARHARRTIGEADRHGVHAAQDELSFAEAHIFRVLHEQNVHILFRLLAGRSPGNYRACARSRCRRWSIGSERVRHDDAGECSTNPDEFMYCNRPSV